MKICWKLFTQAIQDVNVSSSEQIWMHLALHHLLTIGSSAVSESQTVDKIITKHKEIQSIN